MNDQSLFSLSFHENFLKKDTLISMDNDGDDDIEYIEMLIRKEMKNECTKIQPLVIHDSLKRAREQAIIWTLKKREDFGFGFRTAYLSVYYFDIFLSRKSINNEESGIIEVLSIACLSLAAKMEEIKAPTLSDFHVEEEIGFGSLITKMEFLVLNTLEWKMGLITPFTFLHYFISKLCNNKSQTETSHVLSTSIQLIMTIIQVINLIEHKPSLIAAAAILAAMDRTLPREEIELLIHPISPIDIEEVYECYDLMKKLKMKNQNINLIDSSGLLKPLDTTCSVSSALSLTSKRKRSKFDDHDIITKIGKQ